MEITRPRTCNGNYTPRDLYCTPWESCGEGAYRNLLFYCRGVLTVLKSIHPRRGKKNGVYHVVDLKKEEVVVMVTKSLFSFLCLLFHESSILDQRFFSIQSVSK